MAVGAIVMLFVCVGEEWAVADLFFQLRFGMTFGVHAGIVDIRLFVHCIRGCYIVFIG